MTTYIRAHRNRPEQGDLVELAGFEPAAFSLRKMRSNRSDQGKRYALAGLWRDCGASGVRRGET